MAARISKESAYDLATQWGSFLRNGDPGACTYAFHPDDGRPISEQHRMDCLLWLCSRSPDTVEDATGLLQLIHFLTHTPLRPSTIAGREPCPVPDR